MAQTECVCVILLLFVCCECIGDYYSVLGIPQSASEKEIQRAFCQLALKFHPDKNHSPNAQQVFTHLAQAYEVLSDQERRKLYDQQHLVDQCSKQEGEKDLACSLQKYKGSLYGNNDFLPFSLEELSEMLQMEKDVFMVEDPNMAEDWSFTLWGEGQEEEDPLSNLFGML